MAFDKAHKSQKATLRIGHIGKNMDSISAAKKRVENPGTICYNGSIDY